VVREFEMPRYKVAHVKEQGTNLIIVLLDSAFGRRVPSDQHTIAAELQMRSHSAGLAGHVVPVWDNGGGRMAFLAPPNWHAFFRSINSKWILANINRELYW